MTDDLELIRGSGNVFRDFGDSDADSEQLRAILAAKIVGILDDRGLSVRRAGALTGVPYSEFSRIRNARLGRFTIDRLMTIINKLDHSIDVQVTVKPIGDTASHKEPVPA